jgi:predicted phosphate transport protein (TIGR00153 family)
VASETPPLFGKTRFLAGLIEEFLDKISEGVFMVEAGFQAYLSNTDDQEICEEKLQQVIEIKRSCSDLRRRIVTMLYTEMLLPDARGDVLRLLGNLFELLDEMGDDYQEMMIVQPRGLAGFADDFAELNAMAMRCVQAVVLAARTFFRNPPAVRDHINEVRMFEDETDRIALRIKRKAFASDLGFEQRTQVREATAMLDGLADRAENIGDDLSIYAIKRAL